MKTQCSISGSALGSLTESPLHVLQGNQIGTVEFWRVSARGLSTTPALCKFSCSGPSGDPLQDVVNYFKFVVGHSWSFTTSGGAGHYAQTDTLDASTLEPVLSTIDDETPPDSVTGGLGPLNWNTQLGYRYPYGPGGGIDSSTSSSGADWDASSTRAGFIAVLDAVNWTALWAGSLAEANNFQYDRAAISPNNEVTPPFDTSATGDLIPGHAVIGPNLTLSGRVGDVSSPTAGGFAIANGEGTLLERAQIKIRNFTVPVIPYFIYESTDIAAGVTILGGSTVRDNAALSLADTNTVYRKVSEGVWDHDLQIIQLPEADGAPGTISTSFGSRTRFGSAIGMVVGMTFEEWMLSNLGPTWADYVFT